MKILNNKHTFKDNVLRTDPPSHKRSRAECEEGLSSKVAKINSTCSSNLTVNEQQDLDHPDWKTEKLYGGINIFNHVQNRWRPKTLTDPHKNLTRFQRNTASVYTGFRLPGNNYNYVQIASIYTDQIRLINNSLWKIRDEIAYLCRNWRERSRSRHNQRRLDYLKRCQDKLRAELQKIDYAKCSACNLYSHYYNPTTGLTSNSITTKQKSEAEHTIKILETIKSFYANPS